MWSSATVRDFSRALATAVATAVATALGCSRCATQWPRDSHRQPWQMQLVATLILGRFDSTHPRLVELMRWPFPPALTL